MTNLTKEEYAKLHLKAKRGLLTPEEQAVYFEYKEEQAEAARVNTQPPVQPQTPPVRAGHHGCLYWVFVGWWVEPLILLFITVPRLIFNAAKPRTKTHAVCQTCGHSWTVR